MSESVAPKPGGGVPALERALNMLELLAQSRKGYSVSELSRRLSLPKSSVHLLLRTFERRGYLEKHAATGRYRFGLKLLGLGRAALDGIELREEAGPAMAALSHQTGLTVHLGVLERSEVVIVERVEAPAPVRVVSWVGRRLAVNSTALGKALLAYLPDDVFESRIRGDQLPRHNDRTIATLPALKRELEHVRESGYALCDEEDELGIRCVAAPIRNGSGQALAAIATVGTVTQIPLERVPDLAEAVKAAAGEIEGEVQKVDAAGK